jgi:hypothetical protein
MARLPIVGIRGVEPAPGGAPAPHVASAAGPGRGQLAATVAQEFARAAAWVRPPIADAEGPAALSDGVSAHSTDLVQQMLYYASAGAPPVVPPAAPDVELPTADAARAFPELSMDPSTWADCTAPPCAGTARDAPARALQRLSLRGQASPAVLEGCGSLYLARPSDEAEFKHGRGARARAEASEGTRVALRGLEMKQQHAALRRRLLLEHGPTNVTKSDRRDNAFLDKI